MKTLLLIAAFALAGCSTVTPVPVAAHSVAFDGSYADAGVPTALNPVKAANGAVIGWRVTAFWVTTFEARLTRFGARLTPPMTVASYRAVARQMPDAPPYGATWFVSDALMDADAKLAQIERDTPK